ncbi:hypothetical protein [Streptomyces albireticuli]|nr:hypothetical protein [Streptomyces albireticuli]
MHEPDGVTAVLRHAVSGAVVHTEPGEELDADQAIVLTCTK